MHEGCTPWGPCYAVESWRQPVDHGRWRVLGSVPPVTMFADMLERDRKRSGLTVGQAAWRLDVKPREYVELESGDRWPDFDTYDRICKLFGWPQTFTTFRT